MIGRRLLGAVAILIFCSVTFARDEKPKITVLAAISLSDAFTEIARDFESVENAKVDFVFGASGQLASQIEAGATADVFIPAAESFVNRLVKQRLAMDVRVIIACNELVLIVPKEAKPAITRFEDLGTANLKRIAIGEPNSVPAGTYAMQTLTHLKLERAVADKLIFGANARQVLDYVARGEADAGIVYATDAAAVGDKVRIVARAEAAWHEAIVYPAVLVMATEEAELAGRFIGTLAGKQGEAVLLRRGFTMLPPRPTTRPSTPPAMTATTRSSD